MSKKKFYITTAIDYVNSLPHIGTAYEKIGADVIARWMRLMGFDVHFQMGNDEHSVNVMKAAKERGQDTKQYCDEMRVFFENIWKELDISYDGFIQTTEPRHMAGVEKLLKRVMDAGDISKQVYKGWYCESCEAFLTEKDLQDGLCPNHKTKPEWLQEENYFFALSKYRDRLLKHIEEHPEFILPEIRRNEILSFLKEELQNISVSRSSVEWGVPVPGDPAHVVYVWFDALINYITAVGFGSNERQFAELWPAEMHVIGKDITRFHCVIWPAMLMSAGLPLPKTVFGHGFVTKDSEKMSKTRGNVVRPSDIVPKFGADPLRYYLLREGSFGRDADFTWGHFLSRYNGDLANGIGNLVSRTVGMATKYQNGVINPPSKSLRESELAKAANALPGKVAKALDPTSGDIEFHNALAYIWEVIASADRHINDSKPWVMAKEGRTPEINNVLWEVAAAVRVCTILLYPFIPKTAQKIWDAFGFDVLGKLKSQKFEDAELSFSPLNKPIKLNLASGIFPRVEEEKTATEPKTVKAKECVKEEKKVEEKIIEPTNLIDISEFAKVELRVAEIVEASKVEGADKLLKLQINLGSEKRQIVAGIAKHYTPEELIGKKIAVVVNLKPAKLRGIESNGMLLAASDESTISILTPFKEVSVGSKIK